LLPFGDSFDPGRGFVVRKVAGWVALAVGAFLLMAAALGQFWAPGNAERTPLDVNTTTRLSGVAQKLNPATGQVEEFPVNATSVTKSDTNRSDDTVIAFVTTTCLVIDRGDVPDCVDAKDPQHRLVTASSDTFATDRHTAVAVDDKKYLAADAQPHQGLVNKFPFDVQKKTYPYWDGILDSTVPAKYDRTDRLQGLTTYKFDVDVPSTPAEVLSGVQGLYTQRKSIWVEPRTGSIVKQTQDETRTLPNGDPLLTLNLEYQPDTVTKAVHDAGDKASKLRLLTGVLPIVGLVGGLLLVILGLWLLLGGRRRSARSGAASEGAPGFSFAR
jgi:Porin PorA